MPQKVQAFDIGCEPSPSIPAETVLQDGSKTYLLFFAVSKAIGQSGCLDNLNVAVLNCDSCVMTKFGYPNDEGIDEHPLYKSGMADLGTSVLEVIDSNWASEVVSQMDSSALRIWGGRGMDWKAADGYRPKHFIITLKETTFECLASNITVERYCLNFDEAFAYVISRLQEN